MLVRPMLLHRMALVSVRLFCKNLGNLQEFFGEMVSPPPPPWQKIARTPMKVAASPFLQSILKQFFLGKLLICWNSPECSN